MGALTAVASYTEEEKRLARAAIQRYGLRTAERVLDETWERAPAQSTLALWSKDESILVTEEDAQFWADADGARKQMLQAEIATRIPSMLGAIDKHISAGEAGKVQQMAIATGIFYDKIVPPAAKGGGISFGDNAQVQLNVIAPPTEKREARRIGEVIEVEAREVSDGMRG